MTKFLQKLLIVFSFIFSELILFFIFRKLNGYYQSEFGGSFNQYLIESGTNQFLFAAYSPKIILYGLIGYSLIVIALITKEIKNPLFFDSLNQVRLSRFIIIVNLISFFIVSLLLFVVPNPRELINHPTTWQAILFTLSPAIWAVYFYTICDAIFPLRQFIKLSVQNWAILVAALLIELIIFPSELMFYFLRFWSELLLVPTIQVATGISHFFGLNYEMLPPTLMKGDPVFGTPQFQVEIGSACSGYEGMFLIVVLLSFYLYIQRETLKVARSLLLIPTAAVLMVLLNGFRIFLLVAIGHYWSPQVAIDGFHTVGGWLNLLVVFILALTSLHFFPFFHKEIKTKNPFVWGDTALLIPLMALIATGLLTKSIATDFAWLYPIHILVATGFIFIFRKSFSSFLAKPSTSSLTIGVVVFALWIYLIPVDAKQSQHFIEDLSSVPYWLALLWLLFRVTGATVIVPIAEEFVFRGYVQPHLQRWLEQNGFKSLGVLLSLSATSVLFGYVHSDILAGSVAGLFYGLAYLQRKQLVDAIIAHAVTNGLLAVYVMTFGYWSYW